MIIPFIQKWIDRNATPSPYCYYECHWQEALQKLIEEKIAKWILFQWNKNIDFIRQQIWFQKIWKDAITYAYVYDIIRNWEQITSLVPCGANVPLYCGRKVIIAQPNN